MNKESLEYVHNISKIPEMLSKEEKRILIKLLKKWGKL
jgi:hypothetical protein